MSYKIQYTTRFKRSVKKCAKRGLDMSRLRNVISQLAASGTLPAQYKPHKLTGTLSGCWECHIQPDWLLVWRQDNDVLLLIFIDTGTHSDLFDK